MLCRGCICTIYDRIYEVTSHPLLQQGEGKKKEDMKGTFGEIYKMKIDAYNSYYQQMRLLGKVNETLSFDEWEKKHCKWLK